MKEKNKSKQKTKKKKNWKKIIVISVSCLLVLSLAGVVGYKRIVEPIINQKLDTVIKTIENVSNNESTQREIDSVVQSMIDDGVITKDSIPQYMKLKEENEAQWDEKRITEQLEKINKEKENETSQQNKNGEIKTPDKETVEKSSTQKTATPAPVQTPTPTPEPTPAQTETSAGATGGDLRSRMKAAMTASEFAFATYMYGKIDLGYAQSLYATDKAAAKQYIYSRVSASEISRALEIYAKYAYLVG